MEAAIDEIKLLKCVDNAAIQNNVDRNTIPIIQLYDHFYHYGPNGKHMVFVFQTLGPNLLEVIKHYKYKGIPIPIVKKLTKDVLVGLAFLHDKCKMIHTDLKPENVLLCYPQPSVEPEKDGVVSYDWENICKILSVDPNTISAPDAVVIPSTELPSKNPDKRRKKRGSVSYPTKCPGIIVSNFSLDETPYTIDCDITIKPSFAHWEYPPEEIYMKTYFLIPYHIIEKLLPDINDSIYKIFI